MRVRPSFCHSSGVTGRVVSRLARLWRQVRLGSAFVVFGLAALSVAFVAAPIARRRAHSAEEAELGVQRAIQRGYAVTVAYMKAVGIVRLDAAGLDGLTGVGPCIVVANHPTLIDVVLLGSRMKQMDCIVNAGWTAHSPFLRRAIDAAGFVRNDAGAEIVDACAERLQRGRRLLVFPEGTRSPVVGLGKFHRGAVHISLASGKPILAVTIRAKPRMLGGKRKWYDVAGRPSHFQLRMAGRLDPASYQRGGASLPLAARRMNEDLLAIYRQETDLADA
jgi:1-acyl-sn-glycerol-3-phosphate acyltransferase